RRLFYRVTIPVFLLSAQMVLASDDCRIDSHGNVFSRNGKCSDEGGTCVLRTTPDNTAYADCSLCNADPTILASWTTGAAIPQNPSTQVFTPIGTWAIDGLGP